MLPTVIAANVDTTSSTGEYACYIHQALCSSPATTLIQALKCSRKLATIPGLTAHLIKIHLPYSTATDKDHMRRHRQGIESTRTMQPAIVQARPDVNSLEPDKEICAAHDMFCFVALANLNTGTMYTDLPGAFPIRFFKSMQYYRFLAYIYVLNTILVHAMPSKNEAAMSTAFTKILATLAARGYKPTLNVTDNECSMMVEAYIKSTRWIFTLSLLTTTESTLPNVPLPHSRNTSLRGWPLSTGTALYNCQMNFCTKSSSPSTFSVSHAVIPANLPTRRSTALMTSTKLQSRQSV